MCGKIRKDKVRNERIRKMIEVAPIEEKMRESIIEVAPIEEKIRENQLRWFGHIQRRLTNAPVRKSDAIHIEGNARGRGRPKLT